MTNIIILSKKHHYCHWKNDEVYNPVSKNEVGAISLRVFMAGNNNFHEQQCP